MAFDILTTSGIDSLVNSFKINERNKFVSPLTSRKTKYQNLVSQWGTVSSKLNSLKLILEDLKKTASNSIFTSKTATSSNSNFITATTQSFASDSNYDIRINQLAKSDIVVSKTFLSTASGDNSITAGTHNLKIVSGDYETNFDVQFDGTETASQIMDKISSAINSDSTATILSAKKVSTSGNITIDSSNNQFTINLNGTLTNVTLENGTGLTYNDVIDRIVNAVNNSSIGVTAEKIISNESGTDYVQLKLSADNSQNYITIDNTSQTLLQDLQVSANKEKGAATLISASTFSPISGYSKLSLSAKSTGYSNRLMITSDEAFSAIGLTNEILSNRYANTDDGINVNDNEAGFVYGTYYLDSSLNPQGTVESLTNNKLNSQFNFNGLNIQRDSNIINDLVTGVTFNLKAVMTATDSNVTISITKDISKIRSKIDEFISKFNDVYTYIKGKSKTDSDLGTRGIFVGESSAISILSTLTSNSYQQVSGIPEGEISFLSQIGISFNPQTGLSISDDSKLTDALNNKIGQVENLFNSSNGIANRLYDSISVYLGTDGVISNLLNSYNSDIDYISNKIDAMNSRIDKNAESLRNRYQQLQSQLAALLTFQANFFGTG